MSRKPNGKCRVRNNKVDPCDVLSRTVNSGNGRGPLGVSEWNMVNITTGKLVRRFYAAKSGEFAKRSIAFNFCPFCGASIDVCSEGPSQPYKKEAA